MRLISVQAHNFRSYATLDYVVPERGVVLVDGVNEDSPGSNGSGKSTLLDAIAFGLYGFLPRGGLADSVVRRGESSCSVRIELQVGPDLWVIDRRRPSKLTVTVNGAPVERKSTDLQRFIEESTMTPERFFVAAYIAQDRDKSFFSMTDAERTQLLSVVANLEQLDTAHDKAKAERDRLKRTLELAETRRDTLAKVLEKDRAYQLERTATVDAAAAAVESARAAYEQAEQKAKEASGALQEQYSLAYAAVLSRRGEAQRTLDEQSAELDRQVAELDQKIVASTSVPDARYQAAINAAELQLREAKKQNEEADRQAYAAKERSSGAHRLEHQANERERMAQTVIENGRCNDCRQLLPEAERNAHADKLRTEAAKLREAAGSLRSQPVTLASKVDLTPLEEAVKVAHSALAAHASELRALPDRLRAEKSALQGQRSALQARIRVLHSESEQEMARLKHEHQAAINAGNTAVAQARVALERAEAAAQSLLAEIDRLAANVQRSEQELATLGGEINSLSDELTLHEELVLLFGPKGYRAACFEGLITQISDLANSFLQRLSDGVFGTRLDQVKEDAKGNAKIVLRPVILKGPEELPLDFLSGGQRRRVAFAYDLAVNLLAGEGLPLLIDEALDGIDEVGKQLALPLLQDIAMTRFVAIIDHTDSLKSAVESSWIVRMSGGISTLEVA